MVSFILLLYSTANSAIAIEPKSVFFGEEINISNNNGTSELPQITSQGNNVYVVWQDNTTGNNDVYFAYSPDNGKTFESLRNLSKNNGTSEFPQVSSSNDNFLVIWKDNSNGIDDVFFKEGRKDILTNNSEFDSLNRIHSFGEVSKPKILANGNDSNTFVSSGELYWDDGDTIVDDFSTHNYHHILYSFTVNKASATLNITKAKTAVRSWGLD